MTFSGLSISGAARSLSFMASSSHFFLQISARSMQHGGGGGFPQKSAFRPLLTQKFSPGSGHPSICTPPSAQPTPAGPTRLSTHPTGSPAGRDRGPAAPAERSDGAGPQAAAGGGGKSAAGPAGRAEDSGRAGPRDGHGDCRGGGG